MSLLCVADFEKKSKRLIDPDYFEFYRTGACDEITLKMNIEGFKRLRIRPRYLRNVSNRNTSVNILGLNLKIPIGVAPTALQKLAHPGGEISTARAVSEMGSLFILSCLASTSIEDVAKLTSHTNKWLQLFIYKDRTLTENLIRRAEISGFRGIVLTIDYPRLGICRNSLRDNFKVPIPLANFTEIFNERESSPKETLVLDNSLTWKDVDWLVKTTSLPVIAKGVLTKEDALLAIDHGCSGIIVSNHGGRQLDGVPAAIEALPEVYKAVENKIPVMMDGGIIQGSDVFKAIALGAKMVFIGRPIIWGLAVNGQKGVENIFTILQKELEATMDLSGCSNTSDITKNLVVHESTYAKL